MRGIRAKEGDAPAGAMEENEEVVPGKHGSRQYHRAGAPGHGVPDTTAEGRRVLERHARSFSLAGRFLPAAVRDDAAVLYAFCRWVDDLADEGDDPAEARAELEAVAHALRRGEAHGVWMEELLRLHHEHGVSLDAAADLVDGALTDLDDPVRMKSDAELIGYAYRVAGTVGLMMCGVLGVHDRAAASHAVDLGIGMQLTNICRDVLEDARRGRVYLPTSRLQEVGLEPDELIDGRPNREAVATVVREMLTMAEHYYDSGEAGMRYIPWRSRVAIRVASRVYRAIGRRLLAHGGDALAGRTVVPAPTRWYWVLAGLFRSLVPEFSSQRGRSACLPRPILPHGSRGSR